MSLFCDTALAARIERFDRALMADATEAVRKRRGDVVRVEISDGLGLWAGPDSPMNKVVGLGFENELDRSALGEYEAAVGTLNSPSQVELCSLARPDIAPILCERGYRLMGFENMSGLRLDSPLPQGDAAVDVAPAGDETDDWIDVMVDGFGTPDRQGNASHEPGPPPELLRRAMSDFSSVPNFHRFLAHVDGEIAGAGGLRVDDGIVSLCGAATLPSFRRKGVQTTLLRHRLHWAAQQGCELAIVTTLPGSKSQQNVQRVGFRLLYTRAMLVLDAKDQDPKSSPIP